MQILPADAGGIRAAIEALASGGIVAHATETCYGLACDIGDPAVVERLFATKDRGRTQPVSALFSSVEDAKRYVAWTARAEELAKEGLPGPLTLVLALRTDAPSLLFPTPDPDPSLARTVGVRVSPHPVALALVKGFGGPLTTTSANVHGLQSPYSSEEICAQFAGREFVPDILLDSGVLPKTPPSKVVDLTKEGEDRILRR